MSLLLRALGHTPEARVSLVLSRVKPLLVLTFLPVFFRQTINHPKGLFSWPLLRRFKRGYFCRVEVSGSAFQLFTRRENKSGRVEGSCVCRVWVVGFSRTTVTWQPQLGVFRGGFLRWAKRGEMVEIMMPASGLVGPTDIRLSSQSACASRCAVMWFSPLLVFAPFSMLSFVVLELPGGNMNPNERGCGNALPHSGLRDEQARYGF